MRFVILMIMTLMDPSAKTVAPPSVVASTSTFNSLAECTTAMKTMNKKVNDVFAAKYPGNRMVSVEKCLKADDAQALAFAINHSVTQPDSDKGKL